MILFLLRNDLIIFTLLRLFNFILRCTRSVFQSWQIQTRNHLLLFILTHTVLALSLLIAIAILLLCTLRILSLILLLRVNLVPYLTHVLLDSSFFDIFATQCCSAFWVMFLLLLILQLILNLNSRLIYRARLIICRIDKLIALETA